MKYTHLNKPYQKTIYLRIILDIYKFKDYLYNHFFITFIIKLVSLRVSSQNKSAFCDVDELACKYLVL